jgi:molecular chaperone GrpE
MAEESFDVRDESQLHGLGGETVLENISQQLNDLQDLFKRRLLDDKLKTAMHETLAQQLQLSQATAEQRPFEPLFKQLLLAVDRLEQGPASQELSNSVVDELIQVIENWGCRRIGEEANFNPKFHEVTETLATHNQTEHGKIHNVIRPGFLIGERVLRPSKVSIYKFEGSSEQVSND